MAATAAGLSNSVVNGDANVGNSTMSAEAVRNQVRRGTAATFVTVDVCAESAVSLALKVNFLQRLIIRSGG
jgi:KaiC/GvpD/RAD55 family RecA-like ATPase